jgi:hypothetical protein
MRVLGSGEYTKSWLGAALLAMFLAAVALAARGRTAAAQAQNVADRVTQAPITAVREIDDPHTGARWLLLHDPSHPGGPGRLALTSDVQNVGPVRVKDREGFPNATVIAVPPRPVIRGGDRLIVEENTAVVEARLEAMALGPAARGSSLQARLQIGGRVVRVVALGPGRAALASELEVRP